MKITSKFRWALLPVLAAASLLGCSRPVVEPEPIRAVRTQTASMAHTGGAKEYAGEVRARSEVRLGFRVVGQLTQRQAEVGKVVKAGQVLAQLDPEDLRLGQNSARAALDAAEANLALAGTEFGRYKELREQGFISVLELERRSVTLKAAQAQVEQARAQAALQRNQAGYATLVATGAGVVTAVDAEVGAVVTAGTPVVRMAIDGARDVVFAVPEDAVEPLKAWVGKSKGLRVRIWGSADEHGATLREVAASADPTTRTFLAKADLGGAAVLLGQTATVFVDLPRVAGVIKLPLTAITRQQEQTAVWVVDKATMTVRVMPVVVAGADGNEVVVSAGLTPGQEIVTAGVHALTPGQRVKLFAATPAAAANAASAAIAAKAVIVPAAAKP